MGLVLTPRRAGLDLSVHGASLILSTSRPTLGLFLRPSESDEDHLLEHLTPIEVVQDSGTYHPQETRSESLPVAETLTDSVSSADPFTVLWAAMPKPAPPGAEPVFVSGAWAWRTPAEGAQAMLQAIESGTEQPGYWIDTAGVL